MAVNGSNGQEFCNNTSGKCSARDSEGHGTHTTSTAAGDCVSSAVLYGVNRGPVCGIAPGAHIIMYRVCLSQGCFSSDSVAAVQQAIADGVNVINFSISGGANPYTDPVEMAFLDATNAGISVNAAAGNSGPGAGTADHGGPWVTTVGAVTGPRSFTSTLHLTADGGATLDVAGVTLTNGISSPTPSSWRRAFRMRTRSASRPWPRAPQRERSSSAIAEATAASTRVAGSCRRRGRHDPLQQRSERDRPRVGQPLPARDPDAVQLERDRELRQQPYERAGDVGAGHSARRARPT